jgi:hypothetical protein
MVIKSRAFRWIGHVTTIQEITIEILTNKPRRKKNF